MIWMIFTKILMNTIQKRRKILTVFDDMIPDMLSNKVTSTVTNTTIYQKQEDSYFSCFY